MNTKVLFVAIVLLTVIIFGANHYAAHEPMQDLLCAECQCMVNITVRNPSQKDQPSCSVVFRNFLRETQRLAATERLVFTACDFLLFCDKNAEAELNCRRQPERDLPSTEMKRVTKIWSQQKCTAMCERRDDDTGVRISCDHWKRASIPPVKSPQKPPAKIRSAMFWSMLFGSQSTGPPPISTFVRVIDNFQTEEKESDVIGDAARWRLIAGEAGIDHGVLVVTSGEAEARSFSTGDGIRLIAPSVLSLPSSQGDFSGRWHGAYARPGAKGTLEAIQVSLNVRREGDSLKGELQTSEATFKIVEGSQSDSAFRLQAERSDTATPGKIILSGRIAKGEILFDGSEQLPGGRTTSVTGFFRRLYIADNALPFALLDQPYSYMLTAFPTQGRTLTFRLANPTAKQPQQIAWDMEAQSLRGRNGEKFTYLCPPNGSLGRLYSRDNAYTDNSSICTAGVSAHLITQQAGGVVTIEIRPGPSPDTGRFVFAGAERETGVSGRLPQGMSFDAKSGTFSGTPTELGTFEISVVADDGAGNTFEQPLTLAVKKMIVTNRWLADAFVGQPYKARLQVRGGTAPYRFTGNVPRGLQLDPNTGELTGTPALTGSGFEVTVRDSQNNSETVKVSLRVRGTTILTSHLIPEATQGVPYHTQFRAVGNSSSINWSVDRDQLSSIGLTLNPQTGELSGTPTKAGEFPFSVKAEASDGHTRSFALVVNQSSTRAGPIKP